VPGPGATVSAAPKRLDWLANAALLHPGIDSGRKAAAPKPLVAAALYVPVWSVRFGMGWVL